MNPVSRWCAGVALAALAAVASQPAPAHARGFAVEVSTNRGQDAVYEPGDRLEIRVRSTDDAYLLVYEIDAEGYVNVLYPYRRSNGFVEGRTTLELPEADADADLVVQGPTGQGYIVAIASLDPFRELPWYLRPYDRQAAEIGYDGEPDDDDAESGVTSQGRIVGDPFVAMERIRRSVLVDSHDEDEFATAFTTYYVHHEVRYPRYLCYDCHRPHQWAWWDGFDPYYSHCSVFDFRVNYTWAWGPTYWFSDVPYYVYVYRHDCPPRYQPSPRIRYSSWDGWRKWNRLWGRGLVRYKTPPPTGYLAPARYVGKKQLPPGFLASAHGDERRTLRTPVVRDGAPDDRGGLRRVRRDETLRRPVEGRMLDGRREVTRREIGRDDRFDRVRVPIREERVERGPVRDERIEREWSPVRERRVQRERGPALDDRDRGPAREVRIEREPVRERRIERERTPVREERLEREPVRERRIEREWTPPAREERRERPREELRFSPPRHETPREERRSEARSSDASRPESRAAEPRPVVVIQPKLEPGGGPFGMRRGR